MNRTPNELKRMAEDVVKLNLPDERNTMRFSPPAWGWSDAMSDTYEIELPSDPPVSSMPNVSDQRPGDRDATKNKSSGIAGFAASDGSTL